MKKLLAAASVLLVAAFGSPATASADNEMPTVVASASPLYDVASTIGGSKIHSIDAVQTDMFGDIPAGKLDGIKDADLVVRIAPGIQPKFDAEIARLAPQARVVDVGQRFPDLKRIDQPYLWQDPNNMMSISEMVRSELSSLQPSQAKGFRDRQMGLIQNMADMERIQTRTLATCEKRSFVTTDPSFDWYSNRFGISQVAADPADPLPALRSNDATTLFSRDLVGYDQARQRLTEWNVRSAAMDPMIGRSDQVRRGGGSYGVSMGLNLDALRNGLGCKKISLGDD